MTEETRNLVLEEWRKLNRNLYGVNRLETSIRNRIEEQEQEAANLIETRKALEKRIRYIESDLEPDEDEMLRMKKDCEL